MKVITDYFTPPHRKSKRKSKNKCDHKVETKDDDTVDDEKLPSDVFYETRKIKIRLADPNVRDSYVCEVYDTSIDEECETEIITSDAKKDAFKLLMAVKDNMKQNDSPKKRGRVIRSAKQDDEGSSSDEALVVVRKKLKKSQSLESLDSNSSKRRKKRNCNMKNLTVDVSPDKNSKNKIKPAGNRTSSVNENFDNNITSDSNENAPKSNNRRKSSVRRNQKSRNGIHNPNLATVSITRKSSTDGNTLSSENDCTVVDSKMSNRPLAPIFMKNTKQTIDPEVLKARKEFLKSGIPASVQKTKDLIKAQMEMEVPFFPMISHVQQKCEDNCCWHTRDVKLPLRNLPEYDPCKIKWSKKLLHSEKVEPTNEIKGKSKDENCSIERIRTAYKNVPIDGLHASIKVKHAKYLNNPSPRRKGRQKSKELKKTNTENECPMWTVKYRPDTIDIMSNDRVVSRLRKWLEDWKAFDEALKSGLATEKKNASDSDDAFVTSDEDDDDICKAPPTACLLQGPVSCGKTALLHALAAEMDLNILEINAGSRRSGKKILAELQEATQSRKVLHESIIPNGKINSSRVGMSMIVVEEADVVFDDLDDGFVFGLQTLINSAKRPVFLLTSDPTVKHIEKFQTGQTIQVSMNRPPTAVACAVLELIALVERSFPPRSALLRLLRRNKNDLRRSILDLQFWSGQEKNSNSKWSAMGREPLNTNRVWWGSHQLLFRAPLWHSSIADVQSPRLSEQLPSSSIDDDGSEEVEKVVCQFHVLSNFFDTLSVADVLSDNLMENGFNAFSKYSAKDSLSLEENKSTHRWHHRLLKRELTENLLTRCVNMSSQESVKWAHFDVGMPQHESRWLQTHSKAMDELLTIPSTTSSRRVKYVDYLSSLRTICRAEQQRSAENTKRRNRFYHYIRTLGGSPTESNLSINCAALSCEMNSEL